MQMLHKRKANYPKSANKYEMKTDSPMGNLKDYREKCNKCGTSHAIRQCLEYGRT